MQIQMKISAKEALRELARIDHKTAKQGVRRYWYTYKDQQGKDQATAQSIAWLSRWAATGKNSPSAKKQAQEAFNAIFDRSFQWLCVRLPREDAEKLRYKDRKKKVAKREQYFANCLKRNAPTSKRRP